MASTKSPGSRAGEPERLLLFVVGVICRWSLRCHKSATEVVKNNTLNTLKIKKGVFMNFSVWENKFFRVS